MTRSHTLHTPLIGAILLAAASFASAEPLRIDAAHQAYHGGEYQRSLVLYERLAAQGNAEAAERAGYMLLQGAAAYGPQIPRDLARATALLEQAAGAGRQTALFFLSMLGSAD
ncbi:hypothetical protein [Hydrogenophaga sp. ZJX-1]|uniref:hypothetical protein n=1 Tax=Hydrogenophaga sp. ZJX-1 TaxID=3404778 RepID=UPI003B281B7C